jgi:hypothetical protein
MMPDPVAKVLAPNVRSPALLRSRRPVIRHLLSLCRTSRGGILYFSVGLCVGILHLARRCPLHDGSVDPLVSVTGA